MEKVRLSDLYAEDQKTKLSTTTLETPFEMKFRGRFLEVVELDYKEDWFDDSEAGSEERFRDFTVQIATIKIITMDETPCEVIISDQDMYVLNREIKDILCQWKYNLSN